MIYFTKIPKWLHRIYPHSIWEMPPDEKNIYLTFDDGPTNQLTEFIVHQLALFHARATFFCIGAHVRKRPGLYELLISSGHSTGNHTLDHLDGWRTHSETYLQSVQETQKLIHSNLFRPPFGRLKRKQLKLLHQHQFRNIMWSITSGDFDRGLTPEQCFMNIYKNIYPGAIILMHDHILAAEKIQYVLPKLLHQLSAEGYTFKSIEL